MPPNRSRPLDEDLHVDSAADLLSRPLSNLSVGSHHRIIVGVDYGTTYTGVSYIDSARSSECTVKDVHDIRSFPGLAGTAEWKMPSRIAYVAGSGGRTTKHIGFQVTPKMTSYSWTKLLLDDNARPTEFDDPSLARTEGEGLLQLPPGKTVVEVVSDFFKALYKWIMDHLARTISKQILDATPLEFWFTVPAIWSDQAKNRTIAAATAAGFASRDNDVISLVPEPEAAGIAIMRTIEEGVTVSRTKPGDGVLICDCGGGTVDITSYKIEQVTPKLEIKELVEGIGGKCGSTYVDREFHQWMSRIFGHHFDDLPAEKIGPGSKFMTEFESCKRDFGHSGDLDKEYEINLVMRKTSETRYYNREEWIIKLPGQAMQSFFEPVVGKILSLLREQIVRTDERYKARVLNRIFLVGGFGDSVYLNERIRQWCDTSGLTVLCPEHPQAAIARGAALRGLECIVPIRRRSRRHYGLAVMQAFRQGEDPEKSAQTCVWTGDKLCNARIDWAVAKGDVIDEGTKIGVPMYSTYKEGDSFTQKSTLYSCATDAKPDYCWDPAVEHVADLNYTIDSTTLSKFETKMENGKTLYRVAYDIEVHLGAKKGALEFLVINGGGQWGRTEIDYDASTSRNEK